MQLMKIFVLLLLPYLCSILPAHADNTETEPPPQKVLHVAALPFLSSAPLFIAQFEKYYEAQGLRVIFHFKKSAQAVAEAVTNKEVTIGVTGLTSGFLQLTTQHPLRIIAGQYREIKGHAGSMFIASNNAYDNGLTNINELSGHESFGLTTEGSTFHHWFGITVDKLGLPLSGFDLKPLNTVQAMRNALVRNDVDLIISSSLVAHSLERGEHGKIIGKVADYSPGQLGVVFTLQDTIDQQRTSIINFLHAYQLACSDYYHVLIQKPDQEEFTKLLGRINLYLQPKLNLHDASKSIVYISPNAKYNEDDLRKTIRWYQQAGFVPETLDVDVLFNHKLLKEAVHEK